jgi:TPR repeat protein
MRRERDALYLDAISIEEHSPKEAFEKYKLACAMVHVDATFKLAVCYDLGLGTKENRHGAYRWYKKAAELGSKDALLPLGLCYATGRGVPLDYGLARKTLTKAERLGVEEATNAINILMQKKMKKLARQLYSKAMRLIYLKKFDEAKKHLDISSELSCPKAIYTLGCLYEFGMGTPCNKELAFSLYEKAYALLFRDPRSQYKLAVLRMLKAI